MGRSDEVQPREQIHGKGDHLHRPRDCFRLISKRLGDEQEGGEEHPVGAHNLPSFRAHGVTCRQDALQGQETNYSKEGRDD